MRGHLPPVTAAVRPTPGEFSGGVNQCKLPQPFLLGDFDERDWAAKGKLG